MNARRSRRIAQVVVVTLASLLFWVWIYHVLIGGVDPVKGIVYTAATFGLVMAVVIAAALWARWRSGHLSG
jgi:type VI protein secretion system component VasK